MAKFYIATLGAFLETCHGQFEWSLLVKDGLLKERNGAAHIGHLIVNTEQMRLKLVLSILCLLHAGIESVVHIVECSPHLVSTGTEQGVNVTPQLLGGFPLFLRACDVLLSELYPGVRVRDCVVLKIQNVDIYVDISSETGY